MPLCVGVWEPLNKGCAANGTKICVVWAANGNIAVNRILSSIILVTTLLQLLGCDRPCALQELFSFWKANTVLEIKYDNSGQSSFQEFF